MDKNAISEQNGALQQTGTGEEALIELVIGLLTDRKFMDEASIPPQWRGAEPFMRLYEMILDIRVLSHELSKGNLQKFVYSKGYIISNLKALQSNLRHLTWQTQKLAEGDFSQRVDFLGEFSAFYNSMAQKLQAHSEQLKRLAAIDTLTQVPNRRNLDEFLQSEFDNAKKYGTDLSILMFDIDCFKQINDTHGHSAGDVVLAQVSRILSKVFRASDMFARYGGEEFVAVLPGCSVDVAAEIGKRAIKAVGETDLEIPDAKPVRVTLSAGAGEIAQTDTAYIALLNRSDAALYNAKRAGRNCVCICPADHD